MSENRFFLFGYLIMNWSMAFINESVSATRLKGDFELVRDFRLQAVVALKPIFCMGIGI